MKLKSKLFASAVAFTMVLGMVAVPASAQTTAELTAMINSLLAQISQLQAQIAGQGGSTVVTTTFTKDLTIGSTGAEVTALQQFLVSKGHLTMPAGVAFGYFGAMTKTALAKYQVAAGIAPAAGYFGPMTRAKVNALVATPGTQTPGTVTPGTITTPGVEGTLAVTSNNSGLVSTVYEGDSMRAILGFNVEAKVSDISVQRVKLDLGTTSKIYTKGYSKVYVTDGSNVLASSDLNSSTVVKSGSNYYITLTGFNLVVPKGTKKQVVIKADVMSSIDSADMSALSLVAISLADRGVRGVDGAGIDQYDGGTSITKTVSFSSSLSETASLKLSLNNATPAAQDIVASEGSGDNELDKLSLLTFDLKATKGDMKVTDITVDITYGTGGTATATTLYLFDGSTELDNAASNGVSATFSNLDLVVSKDTTKTLTVKGDVRSADGTVRTMAVKVDAADVVAETTDGDTKTTTGSATGYAMSVRNAGIEIALVSKTTNSTAPQSSGTNSSTSTLTATFNVKVKAVGNDIILGTVASTTNPVFSAANSFQVFKNGIASTLTGATTTSFTIPSTCTVIAGADSCTLAEGNEVTIPVTFQISGRDAAGSAVASGLYSVELQRVNWNFAGTYSNFMDGDVNWRTSDVSFP